MTIDPRKPAWPLGLLAIVLAAGCHGTDGDQVAEANRMRERALAPRRVQLIEPEVREEHPTLEVVGEVRAFELLTLSAEVDGTIDRMLVEVGDRLGTDEPILEIDRSTYGLRLEEAAARVAAAEAELVVSERELERKRNLLSDQTISQAAFDRALASRELAAAQLRAAQAVRDLAQNDFERGVLRAPQAGVVARRFVAAGEWAEVGTALIELTTGERVKIVAEVPQSWATRLHGLREIEFTIAGGEPRAATLHSIDPVLDGASRSFEVVGVADNPSAALRPGMFAQVRLTSPAAVRNLWLPYAAVAPGDMPEVMVVADGRIAVRKVQTGRREAERVEILSGLEEGVEVIREISGLGRGLPVEVTP
ncbi:MAG: efflux RND transporter periplasmic adaptor subunit [bacterium]|nr:efflux RND transporter periplasmic adaptor subunit [bacterium]